MDDRITIPRVGLDLSQFPVVVLSECGVLSDAERVDVMECLEELIDRRGRHALVLDLTQAGVMPQAQRNYIAEAIHMRADAVAEKWAAIAVIVRQPIMTHLPKAAFWLKVSPVPARMFADREEALTWARGCATLTSTGAIPITAQAKGKRRSGG